MAQKSHPYVQAAKISALLFGVSVLVIIFLASFVVATVQENQTIAPERAEKNITPPGRLYLR